GGAELRQQAAPGREQLGRDVGRLTEQALARQQPEVGALQLDADAGRDQAVLAEPPCDLVRALPQVMLDRRAVRRVALERPLRADAERAAVRDDRPRVDCTCEVVQMRSEAPERPLEPVAIAARDVADRS